MDEPLLAPDFVGRQQQIARQQQMAQMLMQRGMSAGQEPTQMAGRVAIRNNPLSGIASLLSGVAGNRMQGQADAQSSQLNSERSQAMAAALKEGLAQLKTNPEAGMAMLASNPDTAKYAAALAPEIYKPKPDMLPQMMGKYTPESIQAYQQSQNLADLKPVTETLTPYQQQMLDIQNRRIDEMGNNAEQRGAPKAPVGYRFTADGNMEAVPGGPADVKAQNAAAIKEAGATDVGQALGTLRDAYNRLEKGGGITSTAKGGLSNLSAASGSSGIGQAFGKAFGTENQSARNDIAMTRPALLAALMKATGMSAKQMDSNAELKLWMATATDPTLDVEANRRALDAIETKYLGAQPAGPAGAPPPASRFKVEVVQ